MMLVTLQSVSDYVRRDTDDDDADLAAIIEAASAAVVNYLGAQAAELMTYDSDDEIVVDSDGVAVDVPSAVQGATRYLAAWFYRHRNQDPEGAFEPGYLPAPVTAMLYPLRDPALA